ncbi:helix-turn-helix domain-containing protein [Arthrobacter globiformis]|uniref:helix-turn-helix domain-containing protein n=1 Tax=Arthrobacter globiformis TaxID=1665 RepID=UPI0027D7B093|nr:helix-turn-helix domain-containing protein [Arthrobacter globiformis]
MAPLLALAILVLLVSVFGVALFSSETRAPANSEAEEKWSKRLLISAVILMPVTAAPLVFVAMPEAVPNRAFAGTSVASLLLLTALTILAVSGLFMRRGRAFHLASVSGALISLVLILWALGMFEDWVLLIAAAITSVLLIFYYRLNILGKDRKAVLRDAKKEGWDGRGPGIFMFAAILVAYFLSSALVLGTRSLLEWPMRKELPAELKELWRGAGGSEVNLSESLQVPPVYAAIGGLLLFGILLALLGMLPACWWLISERGLSPMRPPPSAEPLPRQPPTYYNDIDVEPGATEPGSQRQDMTYRRRRLSAATQRGEAAFGLLTLLTWVAVVLAVAASALQNGQEANTTGIRTFLKPYADLIQDDFAEWGVILAATLILGFMVKNAATSADDRPLAVLWDIMCFLPNAAHPFGAPSYSNRVVPELARRMHDWLQNPSSSGGPSKVLLSAHSLGAVLAIAAIFHLKACKPDVDFTRVRLLTYGVQLRSYFGRFFPELFGPQVLGTIPTRGPSLFSIDPWKKARQNEGADPSLDGFTLVHLLGGVVSAGPTSSTISTSPVWKNIWRRTDYLGFPAYAHSENCIDEYADETEPRCSQFKVATHGNYTATTTYLEVRDQMLSDWPLMLSWEQVKEILNLELPVIDGLVESGELRAAGFDGQKIRRVRADDVEAYMDKASAKNAESITSGHSETETPTDSK